MNDSPNVKVKSSPRKGKTYKFRVPLAEAAELAGGWGDLEELAGDPNVFKTWRQAGDVPADRIIPILLEWWRAHRDVAAEGYRRGREDLLLEIQRLGQPVETRGRIERKARRRRG